MHVTSSRVFQQQKKKIARNCVQHNNCVFRVELDESLCKCVYVSVSSIFLFFVPLVVLYLIRQRLCYLYSRDCLASRDMTVSCRVWLSGRDDCRREWYNSTVVWIKIFYRLRTI